MIASRRLGCSRVSAALMLGIGIGIAHPSPAATGDRELAICADPGNLPFSNDAREGFENRIAEVIARDMKAKVRYTWQIQRRGFLRRTLQSGDCDVVMGASPGLPGVAVTHPYYASTYVFVTRRDRHLQLADFDDPALRKLRIGLHAIAANGSNTPPANALARRGIVDNVVGFPMWGDGEEKSPQGKIIDAVARGDIDAAIVWGPFAGYFAQAHGDELEISPVRADPQMPGLPFTYEISVGVRQGDDRLLAELQDVLDRHRQDIEAILRQYGVPRAGESTAIAEHQAIRTTP